MILTGNEDLRVQKTVESINRVFEEMLLEMDFEKITVTELSRRARINKKTFYVYYDDIESLLSEWQSKISGEYIKRVSKYSLPRDAASVIAEFFRFSEEQGPLYEKVTCGGSYQYIRRRMIRSVSEGSGVRAFEETLPGAFMSSALLEIYRFWIEGGKKLSLEEIITYAQRLILNGLNGCSL